MRERLERSSDVVHRDVIGETFLVPIRGDLADLQEIFLVNEVGAWVWERLSRPSTVDEVVADLANEFEIGEEQAREDLDAFVHELLDAGLVKATEDPEGRST